MKIPLPLVFIITVNLAPAQSLVSNQPYVEIPLGSIKPQGWLRDQLQIMANGSTGHLDEVHAKIKNDNGWLGGKGDGRKVLRAGAVLPGRNWYG